MEMLHRLIPYSSLGSVHYLWGGGGGGLANGETEGLELFGHPQLEHVNVFDPSPLPKMMHLLSNHTLILHLALYSPAFCLLH